MVKTTFHIHKKSLAYTGDFLFSDMHTAITFFGHNKRKDNPV